MQRFDFPVERKSALDLGGDKTSVLKSFKRNSCARKMQSGERAWHDCSKAVELRVNISSRGGE